jgi:hypothetical protein
MDLKRLIHEKDVSVFNRTPINKRRHEITDKLHLLIPTLPYDCCELVIHFQSETLYALLDQLNLLDIIDDSIFCILNDDVAEDVMISISLKSKTNFLFIDPINIEEHYYVYVIDNKFNKTMIIYTSERYMFDYGDYHLDAILSNHVHIENKGMFHEYLLTYDSINSYRLKVNEKFSYHFDYNKDSNEFNNFPGTRYDAAIYTCHSSWMGFDAYRSINDNKAMMLDKFILHLMKLSADSNNITVVIFNQSYYVFGAGGYCGFTIIEIKNDGTIIIPNITLNELLETCKIGDVYKIVNNELILN